MFEDPSFLKQRKDCAFPQTNAAHVGTFSWYNDMFGCAFSYDWFRRNVYTVEAGRETYAFSTRSALPHATL
eukprot:854897-Prorocentrum_lima.AAC.1